MRVISKYSSFALVVTPLVDSTLMSYAVSADFRAYAPISTRLSRNRAHSIDYYKRILSGARCRDCQGVVALLCLYREHLFNSYGSMQVIVFRDRIKPCFSNQLAGCAESFVTLTQSLMLEESLTRDPTSRAIVVEAACKNRSGLSDALYSLAATYESDVIDFMSLIGINREVAQCSFADVDQFVIPAPTLWGLVVSYPTTAEQALNIMEVDVSEYISYKCVGDCHNVRGATVDKRIEQLHRCAVFIGGDSRSARAVSLWIGSLIAQWITVNAWMCLDNPPGYLVALASSFFEDVATMKDFPFTCHNPRRSLPPQAFSTEPLPVENTSMFTWAKILLAVSVLMIICPILIVLFNFIANALRRLVIRIVRKFQVKDEPRPPRSQIAVLDDIQVSRSGSVRGARISRGSLRVRRFSSKRSITATTSMLPVPSTEPSASNEVRNASVDSGEEPISSFVKALISPVVPENPPPMDREINIEKLDSFVRDLVTPYSDTSESLRNSEPTKLDDGNEEETQVNEHTVLIQKDPAIHPQPEPQLTTTHVQVKPVRNAPVEDPNVVDNEYVIYMPPISDYCGLALLIICLVGTGMLGYSLSYGFPIHMSDSFIARPGASLKLPKSRFNGFNAATGCVVEASNLVDLLIISSADVGNNVLCRDGTYKSLPVGDYPLTACIMPEPDLRDLFEPSLEQLCQPSPSAVQAPKVVVMNLSHDGSLKHCFVFLEELGTVAVTQLTRSASVAVGCRGQDRSVQYLQWRGGADACGKFERAGVEPFKRGLEDLCLRDLDPGQDPYASLNIAISSLGIKP